MSGIHGWGGNDHNYGSSGSSSSSRSSYSSNSSYSSYDNTPTPPSKPSDYNPPASSYQTPSYASPARTMSTARSTLAVDTSVKHVSSTRENVILIGLDVTGSMGKWLDEIFKFLPLLHAEAVKLFGGETEILFGSFGDGQFNDKLFVSPFGHDQVLDSYLAAIRHPAYGGGNMIETPEAFLNYIREYVNLDTAKQCYTFVITDEGIAKNFNPHHFQTMTGRMTEFSDTNAALIKKLSLVSDVATIFADAKSYGPNEVDIMRKSWRDIMPEGSLLEMSMPNLVVETMLAFISVRINKLDQFKTEYAKRRGGTQYGDVNLQTVMRSVALTKAAGSVALGAAIPPVGGTKSLGSQLQGTRSLLHPAAKTVIK